MGTAEIQGKLWGAKAKDWADYAENLSAPLFEHIMNITDINRNTKVLDIGCGAGTFNRMANSRGAVSCGFDASEELINIAQQRYPDIDFLTGEMEDLPYADNSFDVVTGTNSFQFAGNHVKALCEAGRVTKKNGYIVMTIWGKPEDCEASPVFKAISEFLPPPQPSNTHARLPLYTEGVIEDLMQKAGLKPEPAKEYQLYWYFNNENEALRAMLCAGLVNLAIQKAGEEKVKKTVQRELQQYKRADGKYVIRNTFRYAAAKA